MVDVSVILNKEYIKDESRSVHVSDRKKESTNFMICGQEGRSKCNIFSDSSDITKHTVNQRCEIYIKKFHPHLN